MNTLNSLATVTSKYFDSACNSKLYQVRLRNSPINSTKIFWSPCILKLYFITVRLHVVLWIVFHGVFSVLQILLLQEQVSSTSWASGRPLPLPTGPTKTEKDNSRPPQFHPGARSTFVTRMHDLWTWLRSLWCNHHRLERIF